MNITDPSKPPATVGELRQRLKALGDPWTVAAHLDDEDRLPRRGSGGALQRSDAKPTPGVRVISSPAEFEAIVRAEPPANPHLSRRWVELGVLPASRVVGPLTAPAGNRAQTDWGVA
ncbi:MAG: hypothetical protein JSR59_27360 [Proteobacteria bacterium]|nr:hypothetical protein [Pseudomonadota bacterium]